MAEQNIEYETFYEQHKNLDVAALIGLLFLKEKSNKMLHKSVDERTAVIEAVADYVGVKDKGLYLFGIFEDGTTPILDVLKKYLDNGGDKVKLKKRIAELETENSVLRTLIKN